jgi:hypothetical protein
LRIVRRLEVVQIYLLPTHSICVCDVRRALRLGLRQLGSSFGLALLLLGRIKVFWEE